MRAEDTFEGVILRELMAAEAAQDPNDPGFLTPDEIEERECENKRAYDDLLGVMSGKLITEVRKAVSDIFPNGCAAKAFSKVLTKIKEITDGQEEDLLSEFGDINALEKGEDPRELFERLENVIQNGTAS